MIKYIFNVKLSKYWFYYFLLQFLYLLLFIHTCSNNNYNYGLWVGEYEDDYPYELNLLSPLHTIGIKKVIAIGKNWFCIFQQNYPLLHLRTPKQQKSLSVLIDEINENEGWMWAPKSRFRACEAYLLPWSSLVLGSCTLKLDLLLHLFDYPHRLSF